MSAVVLTAQYLALSGTDVSAYMKSAQLSLEGAAVDATTMGSSGWNVNLMGLKSGTLSIEVVDDFAAAAIDSILWGHFNTGTSITFEVRPTQSAVGTSNPKITGSVLPNKYTMGASVGELAMKSLEYPLTGAATRATS